MALRPMNNCGADAEADDEKTIMAVIRPARQHDDLLLLLVVYTLMSFIAIQHHRNYYRVACKILILQQPYIFIVYIILPAAHAWYICALLIMITSMTTLRQFSILITSFTLMDIRECYRDCCMMVSCMFNACTLHFNRAATESNE